MTKRSSPVNHGRKAASGMVIGRERFAKISAVEGIKRSAAAQQRAEELDRLGLSPEERRRAILRAHRKG